MGRNITIANQKGGVGKTTSAANIGAGLERLSYTVLLIDMDPQAHLSYSLGINPDELDCSIYELLKGEATFEKTVIKQKGIHILPSSIRLASAEVEFAGEVGRELFLKNRLTSVEYDFIIIDCPPNFGLMTLNALTASREVIVPMQAEFLSIKGLNKLIEMVEKVQMRINPSIYISGIFTTMYDSRLKLHNEVYDKIGMFFPNERLNTIIRKNVSLAEAASFGKSIFEYAPGSHGAEDYQAICAEIKNMESYYGKKDTHK